MKNYYRVMLGRKSVHAAAGFEGDQRLKRALAMTPNISFYRYQVTFRLVTG
jgi:hypothetical protein